jgi:divalent metal cation (Fe/Co/Zn/Cd) transporter
VALLADTIHNFSDALTAVPLFIAFRLARRPANQRYTYGYRRAEDLAGLFVVAVVAASALVAAWQAIERLIHPGVRGVSSARVRWLGHRLVADIIIDVDPAHTVGTGHQVATATYQRLTTRVAHIDDVNDHVHPSQQT